MPPQVNTIQKEEAHDGLPAPPHQLHQKLFRKILEISNFGKLGNYLPTHSTWWRAINAATARRFWKPAATDFVSAYTSNPSLVTLLITFYVNFYLFRVFIIYRIFTFFMESHTSTPRPSPTFHRHFNISRICSMHCDVVMLKSKNFSNR